MFLSLLLQKLNFQNISLNLENFHTKKIAYFHSNNVEDFINDSI